MLLDGDGNATYSELTKTGKIRIAKGYNILRKDILEHQDETGGKIH